MSPRGSGGWARFLLLALPMWGLGSPSLKALEDSTTLQEALLALSRQSGFRVEGLERLEPTMVNPAAGDTLRQVRRWLEGYNYTMTLAQPGVIESIRILGVHGATRPRPASAISPITTRRKDSHHEVDARLTGPEGAVKTLTLLIDTGASLLVLPSSMKNELGFTPNRLRPGISQTASGTEPVEMGTLSRVRLGEAEAADVEVAFMPDEKLNGQQLLGMSFLRHFRVTLDDAANELILTPP